MGALRSERGSTLVEFSIVATVLLLLVVGIVQFGVAYHRSQGLEAAAREGGRLAAVGASYEEIASRVRESGSLFDPPDVSVTTSPSAAGAVAPCTIAGVGGFVTVNAVVPASAKYAITIPFWGGAKITYTAKGTFRCERVVSL